jgi:hypothetical protein
MPITLYNKHKILEGFRMIFQQEPDVKSNPDHSISNISLVVQSINSVHWLQLVTLTESVRGNSFCVSLVAEGIKLTFF